MAGFNAQLGKRQAGALAALISHGEWWRGGMCGWNWDTPAGTERIFRSERLRPLVATNTEKRGMDGEVTVYRPIEERIRRSVVVPKYIKELYN